MLVLCFRNQFGVVTRGFVTTSTGGPELFSRRTGNRLRQTISICDLRADLWIANIGPSNLVHGNANQWPFLDCISMLEFITEHH